MTREMAGEWERVGVGEFPRGSRATMWRDVYMYIYQTIGLRRSCVLAHRRRARMLQMVKQNNDLKCLQVAYSIL